MPIPAQNEATLVVNSVFVPTVVITAHIDPTTKQLVSSATLQLRGASVDDGGNWTDCGGGGVVSLPDLSKLPPDLADLASGVGVAFTDILSLVAQINAVRKLV